MSEWADLCPVNFASDLYRFEGQKLLGLKHFCTVPFCCSGFVLFGFAVRVLYSSVMLFGFCTVPFCCSGFVLFGFAVRVLYCSVLMFGFYTVPF